MFWKDSWLASYGPLYRHIIGEIPVDTINYTVADMVDERGKWKWGEFAHIIPMPIVMGVAGHIPPTQDMVADTMIWDQSSNGRFKTKTVYRVQEERRVWIMTQFGRLFGSGREWSESNFFFGLWRTIQ